MKVSAIISGLAVALVAMGVNAADPKSKAQEAQPGQEAQQNQEAQASQASAPAKESAKQ